MVFFYLPLLAFFIFLFFEPDPQCCSIDSSKRASSVSFPVSGHCSAQKRDVFQIKVFSFIQNQHYFFLVFEIYAWSLIKCQHSPPLPHCIRIILSINEWLMYLPMANTKEALWSYFRISTCLPTFFCGFIFHQICFPLHLFWTSKREVCLSVRDSIQRNNFLGQMASSPII